MAANKLSKDAKIYVVTQLAMWERPTVVQRQLKELFDVDVSLPAVIQYDPTRAKVPKKWKQLFDETRERFIKDSTAIPIANKSFRLRELDAIYHSQKLRPAGQQNSVEMRAALEQAAKESGNLYSNRTELTGKGGKPLIPEGSASVVVYLPDNGRGDSTTTPETASPDPADKKT